MEQQIRSRTSLGQGRLVTCKDPYSFFNRFLFWVFHLRVVKYLLKILQKASVWIGLVVPVETVISKVYPIQLPTRPGGLAKKPWERLMRLLLPIVPTRIQKILGYLSADWGQSNMPKGIPEALINPSNKANTGKEDDVSLEEQESWSVILEKDLPEDDSEDITYEPSDTETDSEEFSSQNDTKGILEFEGQDDIIILKEPSDLQVEHVQPAEVNNTPELPAANTELGAEDPAKPSSEEDTSSVDSADGKTEDVSSGDSSAEDDYRL